MKIRVTEIEENAEELKTCNTLSQNLNAMLTKVFAPHTTYEDEDEDELGEDELNEWHDFNTDKPQKSGYYEVEDRTGRVFRTWYEAPVQGFDMMH